MEAFTGLEDLSRRFLNGDSTSTQAFLTAIRPIIGRIARKHAPQLAPDLIDDVFQQTMLLLLQKRRMYNPTRGSAVMFVHLIARRATREVNAQYAPAGRRTRPPLKRDQDARVRFQRESRVLSLDEMQEEDMPSTVRSVEAAEAQLDAELILRRARPDVSQALRRIYLEDLPVAQAAREAHLSRFVLNRLIVSFCSSAAA
jgi:DNA-directed RNA polymerase specialized sigma24 family protein